MEQQTNTPEVKKSNAGRKPTGIKKEPIFFYVESSLIERFTKKELRNKIYNYLNELKNVA